MASVRQLQFDKESDSFDTITDVVHIRTNQKPQITKDTQILVRVKYAPIRPGDKFLISGMFIISLLEYHKLFFAGAIGAFKLPQEIFPRMLH